MPTLAGRVPTLAKCTYLGRGYLAWIGGVPTMGRGYLPWTGGVPTLDGAKLNSIHWLEGRYPPPPSAGR